MPDLKQIESKVLEAKRLYDDLFEHFDEEHDKFRVIFKDFKKDKDWDEELQE